MRLNNSILTNILGPGISPRKGRNLCAQHTENIFPVVIIFQQHKFMIVATLLHSFNSVIIPA